jgi:transposase
MYKKFEEEIEKLNQRVEQQAGERSGTRLLMTHPGVGPITAMDLFLVSRCQFVRSSGRQRPSPPMRPRSHQKISVSRSPCRSANAGCRRTKAK